MQFPQLSSIITSASRITATNWKKIVEYHITLTAETFRGSIDDTNFLLDYVQTLLCCILPRKLKLDKIIKTYLSEKNYGMYCSLNGYNYTELHDRSSKKYRY